MCDKDRWSQEIIPFLDHYMAAMHKDERGELETRATLSRLKMEATQISDQLMTCLGQQVGTTPLPGVIWI